MTTTPTVGSSSCPVRCSLPDCSWCGGTPSTPVPPTLPAPAPWYAEGSTADFSMSEIFTFAQVLDGLGAFEETSDVLYYFEKPWKWTGEHGRWVELNSPGELGEDHAEYVLDNGTKAENFAAWLAARDADEEKIAEDVGRTVSRLAAKVGGRK